MNRSNKMTGNFCVAVHALVYLNNKGETVSSEKLAENICTNPTRVRKVMSMLKKKGLVKSQEGLDGGYILSDKKENISLGQILDAINEKTVCLNWHSGDDDMDCLIASGMAGIMDNIVENLNYSCKDYLDKTTIKTIDSKIFK